MALDVRLSRDVDEPWGFELYGGADDEMPLTIEKIEPDSPAKRAGLLNGDTILTINGEEAIDLSHEEASRRVEGSGHSLTVGVLRGLYDPVLDDQEPLYDYEPGDFGPQSEPTEVVFQIQQFVEPSDLGSNLLDFNNTSAVINDDSTNIPVNESRSLTASPFLTPTKPYRPFSTEPLPEVPPIEDPIILNPNYRDQFGKSPIDNDPDYILNVHYKNLLGEGRFKLPISEQYDPDGTKFKQNVEVEEKLLKYERHVKSLSKDVEVTDAVYKKESLKTDSKQEISSKDVIFEKKDVKTEISKHDETRKESVSIEKKTREEVEEESIKEELQYIEKMRQDIDLEKIEETAMSVVKDSTERAVSVAEEIKKEMDEELSSSEQIIMKSEQKESLKSETTQESTEIKKDVSTSEKIEKKEIILDQEQEYANKKMSREENFEIQEDTNKKMSRKDIKESEISESVSKKDGKVAIQRKSLISEDYQHDEVREEPRRQSQATFEKVENRGGFTKVTKTVTSDTKSDKTGAERAYTIGLQTIPNIRGTIHSSYHYDLLLRTFFIHLTDVMVALSRFLLAQPVFNQVESTTRQSTHETAEKTSKSSQEVIEKAQKTVQEDKTKVVEAKQVSRQLVTPVPVEKKQEVKSVSQKIEKDMKVESKKVEIKEVVKPVAVKQETKVATEARQEQKIEEAAEVKDIVEKKTGAQMAQRTEKKLTQDMTKKMDAVISEFQTIAVEDVKNEMFRRSSRSRSRSQIEEEVMKESDPLEWLSKVDSRRTSQERTEFSKKEFSSSEMKENKSFVEMKQEITQKKIKPPKQTYIAIVESHVFTNKDAIFEEHLTDISETSSVQSAEEINTAIEAIETISSENVALESALHELETAKIVEESHKLATVTAESAATVQKYEELMHDTKEFMKEEFKKETAKQSTDIQKAIVQESREIVEPVVEIETKIDKVEKVAIGINESLSVAEATEVLIEESKCEMKKESFKSEIAKQTADIQEVLIQETKEIYEPVVGIKTKIDQTEKVAIGINESLSVAEASEIVIEESKSDIKEETFKSETAIQSTDIQEVIVQETRQIIEPVVDIKTKIDKKEKVTIEINESLSVAESTEVFIEESKSEISKLEMKEEKVAIVEEERTEEKAIESQAKIVEPEPMEVTETIKVRPKTVHDEYAALKIVKRVEAEGNLSPEIIEVQDISELVSKSLVSKVAVGDQVSIAASTEVSEKSSLVTSTAAKKESLLDISKSRSESTQESSFTAKSMDKKLSLRTDLDTQTSIESPPSTIDTPTPSTVPPTPLTDEYIFKLKLPLAKSRSATPVPRDNTLTPEDEDPHIVKKKLIPHIETKIESLVYDPPLPSPPVEDKPQSPTYSKPVLNGGKLPVYSKLGLKGGKRLPVYRKPGLFGGADEPDFNKEEIREIERKSSLLASAIDETIKSIEEYKEEVGIETKKEAKTQEFQEENVSKSYYESYTKEVKSESTQNGFEEINTQIEEIIEQCNSLADIGKVNNTDDDSNNQGIVSEVDGHEISKNVIKIDVKLDKTDLNNEDEIKSEEKTVKFDNKVDIIEIENAVTENKENIPAVNVITTSEDTKSVKNVESPIQTEIKFETEMNEAKNMTETSAEMKIETEIGKVEDKTEKADPMLGFRPVVFDPENIQKRSNQYIVVQGPTGSQGPRQSPYMTETGELIGTIQGIVDGLEEPVVNEEIAKELGKPGISEEKIATLISGEAEMLREAHVMGLSRVLSSHMHRADDSSVDFQKIKPMINSLKDSEVLKALNEELLRQKEEEKRKEEKKWTTFLQKPKRPVPKAKFGYHGWTEDEQVVVEPYKVKIVKQAKPKVAPDYKPEDFETGPLPWEERAATESSQPPVEPEEPILIPEVPEFLEAVDPLKESEVPDLEETGIPLPPPREPTPPPITEELTPTPKPAPEEFQEEPEEIQEQEEKIEKVEDMESRLAEQLVRSVQGMVDPNASVDQQLAQMRAQLAALAQLPEVIQQSLELVSSQLKKMTHQEAHVEMQRHVEVSHEESQHYQQIEATQNHMSEMQTIQEVNENIIEPTQNGTEQPRQEENMALQEEKMTIQEVDVGHNVPEERTTPVMTEEDLRMEKQKKEQARLEHESRQVKQHPTPRVAKPKRVFGPPDPEQSFAVVLPGGRRWRNTEDVYNEQKISEMFEANSEVIQGKAIGINFMKYEKPPVSLDHLKHSEVYKLVHDMDQPPLKRVEMRTPVMSEADYRERCRSMTPSADKKHLQIPQQFHP